MYLDGHAGAVEAEGEEGALALEALVADAELALGERERVAQVKAAVHVRVRERHHVLVLGVILGCLGVERERGLVYIS